jgi:5-methylthioribose kinase
MVHNSDHDHETFVFFYISKSHEMVGASDRKATINISGGERPRRVLGLAKFIECQTFLNGDKHFSLMSSSSDLYTCQTRTALAN